MLLRLSIEIIINQKFVVLELSHTAPTAFAFKSYLCILYIYLHKKEMYFDVELVANI